MGNTSTPDNAENIRRIILDNSSDEMWRYVDTWQGVVNRSGKMYPGEYAAFHQIRYALDVLVKRGTFERKIKEHGYIRYALYRQKPTQPFPGEINE
jgi:hypothetical protein